jgi:hypothetical protein
MLKLTRLTGIKSDELDMMEYVDSTTTYVDKKIEYVDNTYNTIKSNVVTKTNEVIETELYKDIVYAVSVSDYVIGNVFDFVKVNTMLVGEFVYSIPYLKGYLDKGNKYLSVGNDLYSKYDKEDIFESPNLASEMKIEAPLNMNIDMDKLGDLAGLMTNFLDSIGSMNLEMPPIPTQTVQHIDYSQLPPAEDDDNVYFDKNAFLDPKKWGYQENLSSSMILHNKRIDDDLTQLEDDLTPLDEDISEMLNKGSKISDKQLSHAFSTISTITSKKNNSKITLKKKKN